MSVAPLRISLLLTQLCTVEKTAADGPDDIAAMHKALEDAAAGKAATPPEIGKSEHVDPLFEELKKAMGGKPAVDPGVLRAAAHHAAAAATPAAPPAAVHSGKFPAKAPTGVVDTLNEHLKAGLPPAPDLDKSKHVDSLFEALNKIIGASGQEPFKRLNAPDTLTAQLERSAATAAHAHAPMRAAVAAKGRPATDVDLNWLGRHNLADLAGQSLKLQPGIRPEHIPTSPHVFAPHVKASPAVGRWGRALPWLIGGTALAGAGAAVAPSVVGAAAAPRTPPAPTAGIPDSYLLGGAAGLAGLGVGGYMLNNYLKKKRDAATKLDEDTEV